MKKQTQCYLCSQDAELLAENDSFYHMDCAQCGDYKVSPGAAAQLEEATDSCRTDLCRKIRSWMQSDRDQTINQDVLRSMMD